MCKNADRSFCPHLRQQPSKLNCRHINVSVMTVELSLSVLAFYCIALIASVMLAAGAASMITYFRFPFTRSCTAREPFL